MKNYYGKYGGQYVSELMIPALNALEENFLQAISDKKYLDELSELLQHYVGRPTPLTYAKHLSELCGGAQIYLKREDLNHTGAHKINNALGQCLLAKRMNKETVIAETGAGQHGVATATAGALLDLKVIIFMGAEDMNRQSMNVYKMKLLGAEVRPVNTGSKVLKDATNGAIKYWIDNIDNSYYLIGSAIGPAPYPEIVKYFQSVIGKETKNQILNRKNILPDKIFACIGGGSNAIGIFNEFLNSSVALVGVEAGGKGIDTPYHAASLTSGTAGILHGSLMYLLQNSLGNIQEAYSISPGLDYPGIGPEHCYLKDIKRVRYEVINDDEALHALRLLCKVEGIIPALESSHALAQCIKEATAAPETALYIVCLSGRGDKDLLTLEKLEV